MFAVRSLIITIALALSSTANAQDSSQVTQGAALFKQHCARCHGANGQGGEGFATPLWGKQSQIKKFKTADELYEYNVGVMPFDNPGVIDEKQKLAIVAFILANHEVIKRNETVDEKKLPKLNLP